MKQLFAATAAATLALGMGSTAIAHDHGDMAKKKQATKIVERNAKGKATKVQIGEKVYDVCMSEKQDSCINPRAAGLNWGDRPLDYWPGKPASS